MIKGGKHGAEQGEEAEAVIADLRIHAPEAEVVDQFQNEAHRQREMEQRMGLFGQSRRGLQAEADGAEQQRKAAGSDIGRKGGDGGRRGQQSGGNEGAGGNISRGYDALSGAERQREPSGIARTEERGKYLAGGQIRQREENAEQGKHRCGQHG